MFLTLIRPKGRWPRAVSARFHILFEHNVPVEWQSVFYLCQVMAGMEGRVVSLETGEDVNPGEEGEILLKGPNVMTGYLGNPGATAATVDSEGWIHTGDVGK